ncbi:MAG: hypothetical protein ACTSR3_10170 [Candidatus Helarchaeota archaeon]
MATIPTTKIRETYGSIYMNIAIINIIKAIGINIIYANTVTTKLVKLGHRFRLTALLSGW